MFSLAIPTYDDYDALVCCIRANIMLHGKYIDEITICDNNPDGKHGQLVVEMCLAAGWNYLSLGKVTGSAITKDTAIRGCKPGNWVVCLDSHVLLYPGFFDAFLATNPDIGDLHHGPLIHDDGVHFATSLDQTWSDGMHGQWHKDAAYVAGEPSFEITNAATGMFIVHRDTWLGFNPKFRGFGGEESYLQKKYLQSNRSVICVSGCTWWHKFGKPYGVPYPLSGQDKFNNYMIGWKELGLPVQEVIDAFVKDKIIPPPTVLHGSTLADAYTLAKLSEQDITEHMPYLESLAESSLTIDIGSRLSSTIVLAMRSEVTVHMGTLSSGDVDSINRLLPANRVLIDGRRLNNSTLTPVQCVLIDTDPHTEDAVTEQLNLYGLLSTRYIILHDTSSYPDVMKAVLAFVKANQQYTVIHKTHVNNGLCVLSCHADDKKAIPPLGRRVLTFARALTNHIVAGGEKVTEEEYQERLSACDMCTFRNDVRCGQCGCPVDKKAAWKSESCPVGNW